VVSNTNEGIDIVRHGTIPEGKRHSRHRECRLGRGRPFLLAYTYTGRLPEVKPQIVDMAMNASGMNASFQRFVKAPRHVHGAKERRHSATMFRR